jgi:peptide methionine sulfoxide reductase MsrA
VASTVGCFWLVANAVERDPGLAGEVAGRPGVRVATDGYGAGVYEAVVTTLAERR